MSRIPQEFVDIPYEDLDRGEVFRTTHELDPGLVQEYGRLVGASGEDQAVPAYVYCTFLPMFRAMGGRMEQGSVHIRQSMTVHRPAPVGATLDVAVRVVDKYERAGRRYVMIDTEYSHEGAPACTSTGTFLWGYATR